MRKSCDEKSLCSAEDKEQSTSLIPVGEGGSVVHAVLHDPASFYSAALYRPGTAS